MSIELILICILLILVLLLFKRNHNKCVMNEQTLNRNKKAVEELKEKLEKNISSLQEENNILYDKLDNIEKKLDFYVNIEKESENLTVNDNEEECRQIIEKAKEQLEINNPSDNYESKDKILDEEQEKAYHYICSSSNNVFITGKAGTGKSFLLNLFISTSGKSNIVLAPTGIAALNVHGATLHSTFGYSNLTNLSVENISASTIKLNSEKKLILKEVQTIIIDEISMVRADVFDKIDKILKVINDNNSPFGGKQIIVFGDLFQLPPIATAEEEKFLKDVYGGIYFFNSNSYKSAQFKFIELTRNHRQSNDIKFFEILNRVREGTINDNDIGLLNKRVLCDESIYDRYTMLFPQKAPAEKVNRERLEALGTKKYTYQAEVIIGKDKLKTKSLESLFPITETLELKIGALVMMTANDPKKRWVNGTLGIVNSLDDKVIHISINGYTYQIFPCEFSQKDYIYDREKGAITAIDSIVVSQFPVVLAYAITIHKSQGQTYSNIICDVKNSFATGQAYVALSRCVSLEGLHLKSEITPDNIKVDQDVRDFYQSQVKNAV